jgi:hypothetical protein
MMRASLVAVLMLGCGSPQQPSPPTSPPPPPGSPGSPGCRPPGASHVMTPEECACLGGRVNLSRGGEQEHCAPGEVELSAIRIGIEGGWCCKAP